MMIARKTDSLSILADFLANFMVQTSKPNDEALAGHSSARGRGRGLTWRNSSDLYSLVRLPIMPNPLSRFQDGSVFENRS